MSDCFSQAVAETLVALKDIRDGLGPPPTASSAAMDRLRLLSPRKTASDNTPDEAASIGKTPVASPRAEFAASPLPAELLFVAEMPPANGRSEADLRTTPAGQLLAKILLAMRFTREEVSVVSLPPPAASPTGDPLPCPPWLKEHIAALKPKVIVALGASAAGSLLARREPAEALRGRWLAFQDIPVRATAPLTDLLRDQTNTEKRGLWQDMLQVLEKLGKPISEKQRQFFQPNAAAKTG